MKSCSVPFFSFAKGCATVADVESSKPTCDAYLILLGERQGNHQKWMVSIESLIVCEGSNLATFLTGIVTCFSTFYILNLQYQEEAACTLEFFQR
ncbi:hypothetical protein AALO_G00269010 [Alosa alosa]|uniref:Uncharacterized protein n=1 Tax=Alosa alosa TaxID=278164 RepID=A0AAV6FQ54_9TELE|nr:hypothetical protein AALO_G00269010 [Alosa alosa]